MSVLLSRIDPTKLYLPFLMRVRGLLDEASEAGADYWVISGFRSYPEQAALYAQGRNGDKRVVVTYARPGESAHQFGVAVDLCRDGYIDRAGLQPDWRSDSYEPLRGLAPKHGLDWGGFWSHPKTDRPHLQWPNFNLAELRTAHELGGLVAVFRHLTAQEKRR